MGAFIDRQLEDAYDHLYRFSPNPGHSTILLDSSPLPAWKYSLLAPFNFIASQTYSMLTGIVPRPVRPNDLRLIWYLHNGKENMKDWELFQAPIVGENYDILCEHEEVRRVVVMGYSNQNPWAQECNEMEAKLRKMKAEARRARIAQEKLGKESAARKIRIPIDCDDLSDGAVASHKRAEEEQERADACWVDLVRERS